MRLTRMSEIAIGALAICARKPNGMVSTRSIADQTGTTKDHAAQIVAMLVRNGYLASERGRAGGLRLAVDPEHITLGDVLRLTQPELSGPDDEHGGNRPASSHALDMIVEAASASFVRLMGRFTIVDLIAAPAIGRIACVDCELVNPAVRREAKTPFRSEPHPTFPAHPALRAPSSSAASPPA